METHSITQKSRNSYRPLRWLTMACLSLGILHSSQASPDEWVSQLNTAGLTSWNYFAEGDVTSVAPTAPARSGSSQTVVSSLSCLPNVNVSLGEQGFAILTALQLVNAPEYPIYLYTVDIMGPLTNTVYCAQIGQDVMVVVTDPTGNSCMSTVHVEDKLKPVFHCQPDTLPCNTDIASVNFASLLEPVTDNCDDNLTLWYSYVIQNLPCNPSHFTQQVTVTWTATDDYGNSSTCADILYLQKPSLGQIVFPPDVTVSCVNANTDPTVTGVPTYNNLPIDYACQISVWKNDVLIPMCHGSQKLKRTWTVMDWCNSGTVSHVQIILIVDNNAPNITCPPNITVGTLPGVCKANYTFPTPLVSDACAPANEIDIDIFAAGIPGIFSPGQTVMLGLGSTLITMRATDPCGNTKICQYTVTVKDNNGPVISCPPNITIQCSGSSDPSATGTATATDICDSSPNISYTDATMESQGSCAFGYKIIRTWKAQDDSGNTSCCYQTIELTDNIPPTISCPSNTTVECTDSTAPGNTGSATATDMCDPSPDLSFSDVTESGSCPEEYFIYRTWEATDNCENTSTCVQVIQVRDITPPDITCPPDITVMCVDGTTPDMTGVANAEDNCAPSVDIDYNDVTVTGGPVGQFTLRRTWTATDPCGNSSTCVQLILVFDETPPVITCPANITISCTESSDPDVTGTASATDNCDSDPGIDYADEEGGAECPQANSITRTWIATDDCGNTAICIQLITVVDNVSPELTCPSDVTIECMEDTSTDNTGVASATDNCDPNLIISSSDVLTPGNCPQAGIIARTWFVADACGNSSTCVQFISIVDSTPPQITCPEDVTIECSESTSPDNTGSASGTDLCDPEVLISSFDILIGNGCEQGVTINRTWTVADACGNATTCLQVITIRDNTAPDITCPGDVTIDCSAGTDPANTGTPATEDNCDLQVQLSFVDDMGGGNGGCSQGVITRTWTAEDDCGNQSTCVQIIEIHDMTPPVILCPEDVTIGCNEDTSTENTGEATATDACDPDVALTHSDVITGGACPEASTITRTWTAVDQCENSSTCIQIITIVDNAAPVITCPDDVTLNCGASTSPDATGFATATDNCAVEVSIDFSDIVAGGGCPDDQTITRTWTAADNCGNESVCIQIIQIQDNAAPVISCPDDVTIECSADTDPSNTGMPAVSDVCDANVEASFTDDVVGDCPSTLTINRTWSAADACGNASTCLQVIQLTDNTAPVCAAHDITITLNGNGIFTITPEMVDDGSSDNCSPVTLDLDHDTFTCEDVGVQVVFLTVTDCAGNSSSCSANVTVNDSGNLQASCQNVVIILDANGNASVSAIQVDNGSGGGCNSGDLDFELSQTSFNCTNIGPNIVVLTVTDQEGNTSTCTAIITVVDNTPPMITCPANVTVNCQDVTNPDNTGQFGTATATDNCPPANITETHVINLNDCSVGTIVRTFTATDGSGNTATCTQTVTVINPNPLDETDITWPPSPVSVDICNQTDPDHIPNGVPIINPGALNCADVDITFMDVVVTNVDNNPATPCMVITRTWTIVDHCQSNMTFTFVQTINVQDMVAPVFTNINDMTKTAGANCTANFTLIASATDCAGVTITNNSPYGATTGANASGNYPIGVTIVVFTATDGCGNTKTMDVVITVLDPDPAEFMCEKVVEFLPQETEIAISAGDFVIVIEGGCSGAEDYVISYSNTNPFDTLHIFDCGDVGVTTFPLYFWTADGSTLVDSCLTADLELCDPDDFCNDGPDGCSLGLMVTGDVRNETGLPVKDVKVTIANVPMEPDTTNLNGHYMIAGLQHNTQYEVLPILDKNHRAGVSTLDLVMIQKHLLGIAKLSSPYKMIAADANRSGQITAIDLLEIRKLILGITTKFANNTSWRFVEATYSFPDPYNPFAVAFPESMMLDSITHGVDTVNFIGIKVGDVNGSFFNTHFNGGKIESRSDESYGLVARIDDAQLSSRSWQVYALPGQGSVQGMQFGLQVEALSEDQVKGITSDVIPADQWYYDPMASEIRVSFTPAAPVDLTGKVLLSVPKSSVLHDGLWINTSGIHPEAYTGTDLDPEIREVKLEIDERSEEVTNEYQLFQNVPNPFLDGTVIRFALPENENVTVIVRDITGRSIMAREIKGRAGMNELQIKNQELGAPGIYYYTLQTLKASLTRKMSYTSN